MRAIEYIGIIDEKRWRIAEEWFLKAIALDSNFAAAYARLSMVQSDLYWMYFERSEENFAKSKTNAQRARTLAPNLSEAHVAMGHYYYHGKLEYEPALQAYNKAIKLQPNNAEAFLGVGSVLRRQGKTREALEKLRKAFELDPRSGDFATVVGQTHLLLREYDQADQLFDRAILLAPDDVRTYYYKALTYWLSHGDTRAARTVIETALQRKIGLGDPRFRYTLVICDAFEGNLAMALKRLEGIGERDSQMAFMPEDLLVAQVYGWMKNEVQAQNKYNSARQMLVRKIAEDPEDSRLYSSLGLAHAGLGQNADAIRAGKRGVELLPMSKEAWRGSYRLFDLAQIYVMIGELDLALDILDDLLGRPTDAISVALLKIDPTWEPLREHPRFQELLQKYSSGDSE